MSAEPKRSRFELEGEINELEYQLRVTREKLQRTFEDREVLRKMIRAMANVAARRGEL